MPNHLFSQTSISNKNKPEQIKRHQSLLHQIRPSVASPQVCQRPQSQAFNNLFLYFSLLFPICSFAKPDFQSLPFFLLCLCFPLQQKDPADPYTQTDPRVQRESKPKILYFQAQFDLKNVIASSCLSSSAVSLRFSSPHRSATVRKMQDTKHTSQKILGQHHNMFQASLQPLETIKSSQPH